MNRLDFSKDLNKFSFFYKNKNSAIFEINDESQKRIFISRLYYSLYHRLLTELSKEKNLTDPGGHKTLFIALEKQAGNGEFYRRLFTHFKDLRKLREWADYKIDDSLNPETQFTILFEKTNSFINSAKLIASI